MRDYIYQEEVRWFSKIQPFLTPPILKVGSGLGFMTSFIKENFPDTTVLEINIHPEEVNRDRFVLYNGNAFPFGENSFTCSVATFVLHHTKNPQLVIGEMVRVAQRIIILDETTENIFQKIDLVYRDILINHLAGQPSDIYWKSYLSEKSLTEIQERFHLTTIYFLKRPKRSYSKILLVVDKNRGKG